MAFGKLNGQTTFLFDLDGTLLPMDTAAFERVYFQGLSKRMAGLMTAKELLYQVWGGTKCMMSNNGKMTNREAFQNYFNTYTSLDYDQCEMLFDAFYNNEFNDCVSACQLSDVSRQIIETLRSKGYQCAVATNPIFPQVATYARLRWLGIDPESFPLVTTFEDSHYAKPNPQYYQEVCDRLGVAPQSCVMVGNDVREDGIAASLGMRVMLIEDCLLNPKKLPTDAFVMGSLAQFAKWCEELEPIA